MQRRAFLKTSVAAALGVADGAAPAEEPKPAPQRHFFFDGRFQLTRENVRNVIAPCVKHPANPLTLDGKTPWSKGNGYFNIWREPATGEFRGEYAERMADIVGNFARYRNIRSPDGLRWEQYGHPIFNCAAVMRDEVDPDPDRRYKAILTAQAFRGVDDSLNEIGVMSACSADALEWDEFHPIMMHHTAPGHRFIRPGTDDWSGGDSHPCVLWAPTLKKYVALFRTSIDRGAGKRRERTVGRCESADFSTWSPHEIVVRGQPDADARSARGPYDIHGMQAWHCGGIYLGLTEPYYWRKDDDRMHMELIWSADTVHWEAVCPGVDFVPHADPGAPDGGSRNPACAPVALGDEVRVYYGSDSVRFLDPQRQERTSSLFLATFQPDRFAGAAAGATPGLIVTRPLVLTEAVTLNADAAHGVIRAALQTEAGEPLEGYGFADSNALSQDALAAPLRWRDRGAPAGKHRLALQVENATLYALDC